MTTSLKLVRYGEPLIGLSTDITGGKLISGNSPIIIGAIVYTTDDQKYYMITAGDGTVVTYKQPALSV